MPKISIALTTVGKAKDAEKIAKVLIDRHLAACVNIIPGAISYYRWQGKRCRDQEFLLVIKTISSKIKSLEKELLSIHPYEVPEFVHWVLTGGTSKYLKWILENCR